MKSILFFFLQLITKLLVGEINFNQIKMFASARMSEPVPGEQKKDLVVNDAKTYGITLSGKLLNLTIEVAVIVLDHNAPAV